MDEIVQEENIPENLPIKIEDFPLPTDLIISNLGLLLKSVFSEGYIYSKVMLNEKKLTDIISLQPYVNLFYVDISKNYIESIGPLKDMEFLLTLNASFNRIQDISIINNFQLLSELNMEKNQIEVLPKINLPFLKKLNLNYNKISALTGENGEYLINAQTLNSLEIRNNMLTSTIGLRLPWLKLLYLAGNQISDIQLNENYSLVSIHLRDNKIEDLNSFRENITNLRYLNLRHNNLSNLEEIKTLVNLQALQHLVLTENPIDQDEEYRIGVLKCVPHLQRLDKLEFEESDRDLLKVDNPEEAD